MDKIFKDKVAKETETESFEDFQNEVQYVYFHGILFVDNRCHSLNSQFAYEK